MTALERAVQIVNGFAERPEATSGEHARWLIKAIHQAIIEHSEAPGAVATPKAKHAALVDLVAAAEKEKWCIVPPNQETEEWTVYWRFDGEFGYDDEIGNGLTMIDALTEALQGGKNQLSACRPVSVQLRSSDTQQHASAISGHLTAGRCTLVLADPGTGASGGPESPQNSLDDEKGSALNAGPNREQAPGVQTLEQQADPTTPRESLNEHR